MAKEMYAHLTGKPFPEIVPGDDLERFSNEWLYDLRRYSEARQRPVTETDEFGDLE